MFGLVLRCYLPYALLAWIVFFLGRGRSGYKNSVDRNVPSPLRLSKHSSKLRVIRCYTG